MEKYCFAGEVREYLKQHKITRQKFCEMCGISYTHFLKLMKEDFRVPAVAVFKIARVLKKQVYELFKENT